jgi:hypothetical protein
MNDSYYVVRSAKWLQEKPALLVAVASACLYMSSSRFMAGYAHAFGLSVYDFDPSLSRLAAFAVEALVLGLAILLVFHLTVFAFIENSSAKILAYIYWLTVLIAPYLWTAIRIRMWDPTYSLGSTIILVLFWAAVPWTWRSDSLAIQRRIRHADHLDALAARRAARPDPCNRAIRARGLAARARPHDPWGSLRPLVSIPISVALPLWMFCNISYQLGFAKGCDVLRGASSSYNGPPPKTATIKQLFSDGQARLTLEHDEFGGRAIIYRSALGAPPAALFSAPAIDNIESRAMPPAQPTGR